MRSISLLLAAMLPMAAVAEQDAQSANWDYEQLRGSWRVSEIIGSDVKGRDGAEIGEVKDVVLNRNGEIASVLVDAGQLTRGAAVETPEENGARPERMDPTEEPEQRVATRYEGPDTEDNLREEVARLPVTADGHVRIEWQAQNFNPDENVLTLDVGENAIVRSVSDRSQRQEVDVDVDADRGEAEAEIETRDVAAGERNAAPRDRDEFDRSLEADARVAGADGELRASELIGMDVNLSDEESFGEVEDVLVNSDGSAVALVVDSWNFLTKDRYAIPAELSNVNLEDNQIDYQLSSEEVEGFGEFDFDEYLETT